jgi:hypothetical protein
MKTRSLLRFSVLVVLVLILSLSMMVRAHGSQQDEEASPDSFSDELKRLLADVRHGTAGFRDFAGIEEAGYGRFLDCFLNHDVGGMGQHYVSGELVGDDVLDPLQPEALVYEPTTDGEMILVAFEYLVFAEVWDPNNTGREAPVLFDQPFHLKTNIPDTPPVWALHVWLWTHNPEGLFADYNPLVFCPDGYTLTDMTP